MCDKRRGGRGRYGDVVVEGVGVNVDVEDGDDAQNISIELLQLLSESGGAEEGLNYPIL